MLKSLNVDAYLNGYNIDHINCIDMSIAAGAGHYSRENYFYYSFYYTFFRNWTKVSPDDFLAFRNLVIRKLGLELKPNEISQSSELISFLKANLDNGIPPIIPVKYRELFYHTSYMDANNNFNHAILVSDYYTEKPLIAIREFIHIRPIIMSLIRGDAFAKMYLKEDLIAEIWTKSNDGFEIDQSLFHNTVFSIEKKGDPQIHSYQDLLIDFLGSYNNLADNKLSEHVVEFNRKMELIELEPYRRYLSRTFNSPVTIIFDVLEKALDLTGHETAVEKWEHFKVNYMQFRTKFLNKLGFHALRKKFLSDAEQEELFEEIRSKDNELYSLVSSLYSDLKKENNCLGQRNRIINYALGASAKADTYLNSPLSVNGENISWISMASTNTHWLQVDLAKPRTISRFLIKHHGDPNMNTRDFTIQGSNDGNQWFDLVDVKDNNAGETVHKIEPITYRNFRLFITKPALTDNYARIRKFEIWGNE